MLFSQVVGQNLVTARMRSEARSGKVAHAQLLSGPSGFGGLALALAFAQYLNCKNPSEEDSCGACIACRAFALNAYPDLHFSYPTVPRKSGAFNVSLEYLTQWKEIIKEDGAYHTYASWTDKMDAENRQGNITADECRSIVSRLSLTSAYDGYKVHIMWLPEHLGNVGNILLKLLEEPPQKTVFLWVTANEEAVLPTLRSRLQRTAIPRLDTEEVKEAILQRTGAHEDNASTWARMAEGDLAQALYYAKNGSETHTARFIDFMRSCYKPDLIALWKAAESTAILGREGIKDYLAYGLGLLRLCWRHSLGKDVDSQTTGEERSFVTRFGTLIDPVWMDEITSSFTRAEMCIARNGEAKMTLFTLAMELGEVMGKLPPSSIPKPFSSTYA